MKPALQENVPLAPLTTFGVGGPARYFVHAASEAAVLQALEFADHGNLPVFVLGGGSNLLISDDGFPGLVLRPDIRGMQWDADGDRILLQAGAGEDWDGVVAACVERNAAGVECLSGIPGSAGGTPIQNVGAYGQEAAGAFRSLRAVDRQFGRIVGIDRAGCHFGYRSSIFNTTQRDRYIVLDVAYALENDAPPFLEYPELRRRFEAHSRPPGLQDVREAVLAIRRGKGMLITAGDPDCRSAGSFFKNPVLEPAEFERIQSAVPVAIPHYPADGKIKTPAAWLIENTGFHKGFSIGPAAISRRHALALVNKGSAGAADILRLAAEIRAGVERRFGIRLMPEPEFVGFHEEWR